MLVILSPAKTVNFERKNDISVFTEPMFKEEAAGLMEILLEYDPWELGSFMKVSDKLAEAAFKKHMQWSKDHNLNNSKQAILAYYGIVFQALNAEGFDLTDIEFAQKSLRILSGLYGVLRAMDLIKPYRLEMGMKLSNSRGTNLYNFWKDTITDYFNNEIKEHPEKILVNLASAEYSSAIDFNKFDGRVITPIFKEYNKGLYKVVTVNAKKARGMMARYIIKNKIINVEGLKDFDEEGYCYEQSKSTRNEWVFLKL